jgi:DNA-binding transcriptional regulator YdaS (Cro superfamily)
MDAKAQALLIIERLGGTAATAELCEVSPSAVSQWKGDDGIPKHQLKFLRAVRPDVFEDRRRQKTRRINGQRSTDPKT